MNDYNISGGFVYLLRFDRPISNRHTTQHYLGFTDCLAARIQKHAAGGGARLCQVAKERGIGFTVARVWRGDRGLERRLKKRKNGPRLYRGQIVGGAVELSPQQIKELLIAF